MRFKEYLQDSEQRRRFVMRDGVFVEVLEHQRQKEKHQEAKD
jgi:hypothetical protein